MILGIADDGHPAAARFNFRALRHCIRCVIRTFGVKIGTDFANDRAHVSFRKYHNGVDISERSQNLRALFGGHQGASGAFQLAHRIITVDRDDEFFAKLAGAMQVTHMPDVQQVEAAVRQSDALATLAPSGDALLEFFTRDYLRMNRRIQIKELPLRSILERDWWRFFERVRQLLPANRRRAALHHHDAAGVIGQLRSLFRSSTCR